MQIDLDQKKKKMRIHSIVWYIMTAAYLLLYSCVGDWVLHSSPENDWNMMFYCICTGIYAAYSLGDMIYQRVKYKGNTPIFRYAVAIALSLLNCALFYGNYLMTAARGR